MTLFEFLKDFKETPPKKKLRLPKKLVRLFGETLSDVAALKPTLGLTWKIGLTKRDDKVWLNNGWPEFVHHFGLDKGRSIFFRYEGNSEFSASIFDNRKSICQIYRIKPKINSSDENEVKRNARRGSSGNPIEISGSCSFSCSDDEVSMPVPPCTSTLKRTRADGRCKGKTPVNDSSNEDLIGSNSEPVNIHKLCPCGKLRGGVEKTRERTQSPKMNKKAEEALPSDVAGPTKSGNPSVVVMMKPTAVNYPFRLHLPITFWREHLNCRAGDVVLYGSEGRVWIAKLIIKIEGGYPKPKILGNPWKQFTEDNNLAVGDSCTFELIDRTKISLKVTISRAANDSNSQPEEPSSDSQRRTKKMSRRNKKRKEEICEDYCFSCKDGGLLRICDYKDCLKAYHPDCVDKDETFLESEERWSCKWHSCFICDNRVSKFRCLCCPLAVCGRCLHDAELVIIKANKGICQNCLNLAILCEIGSPDDSEEIVDFKDENSYEFFFIGYWEYIKEKEGLTRESLNHAKECLKNDKNYRNDLFFHQTGKIEENIGESEEESDFIVSDYDDSEEPWKKRRKSKKKSGGAKKQEKPKKKEFNGWGSQSLLEFLHCVGRDTNEPMSENEVVSIVMKYCVENKLFDPQKRKRIICDEMLRSLFGKKFVLKNSLSKLLGAHFALNIDESSGAEIVSSSDDEDNVVFKRRKKSSSPQKTLKEKEKVKPDVPKSCYALVATENIKLVYLKRSLVDELSKQEEEFKHKVVGSFVRVKCNPNDYLQINSHQLLQVKGVTKSSNGNILLQLFDRPENFPFDELSDDNFTEEECEDLCRKVKDGLLKKLTIVELEQKARSLHEDMTNHWITKELALLRRRIDQANEKGWRRELNEYLERILLWNRPSKRIPAEFNLAYIVRPPWLEHQNQAIHIYIHI